MLIFDLYKLYSEGNTVFHEGKELTDAALWKNRTNAANKLIVVLSGAIGIAKIAGYDIEVDDQTLSQVAVGVAAGVAFYNNIMHVITSAKIGIKSGAVSDD